MTNGSVAQPQEGAPAQAVEAFFDPSLFQTLFWRPRFLPEAATVTHLPFLFWLSVVLQPQRVAVIGCDDGAAHFAMCQALEKLGHDAQCRGYGFWSNGESGTPLVEPPAELVKHEAMLYDGLSKFIPAASVEDATDWLSEAPVELLFVDLEAVPKETHISSEALVSCLAAPGVILLHGTNELRHRPSDGRTLASFIQASRHVEFPAEKGLVLIAEEHDLPAPLRSLMECTRKGMLRNDIELVFRRSGQCLKHSAQAESRAETLEVKQRILSATSQQLNAALEEIKNLRESYDLRSRKLSETQSELFELRSEIDRLNAEIETERARLDAAQAEREAERAARFEETAALTRIAEDLRAQLAAVETKCNVERREKEKLQKWKDMLLKSTSWRVTAPMRSIKETFSRQTR